jgi:hypothetical protein
MEGLVFISCHVIWKSLWKLVFIDALRVCLDHLKLKFIDGLMF